jgi:hypothetical protein
MGSDQKILRVNASDKLNCTGIILLDRMSPDMLLHVYSSFDSFRCLLSPFKSKYVCYVIMH